MPLKDLRTRQEMIEAYQEARGRIQNAALRLALRLNAPPEPSPPPEPGPPPKSSREIISDKLKARDGVRQGAILEIVLVVANHYQVNPALLISDDRHQELIQPRFVAIYLARNITNLSTMQLGVAFNRDHSSILHALTRISGVIRQDKMTAQLVDTLRAKIEQSLLPQYGRPQACEAHDVDATVASPANPTMDKIP